MGAAIVATATEDVDGNWMSFYTRFANQFVFKSTYCLVTQLRAANCKEALDNEDDGDRRPERNLNSPSGRSIAAYDVS